MSGLDAASDAKFVTVSYDYIEGSHLYGMLLSETDSLGRATRYFYDDLDGKLLATVNMSTGEGTAYVYDDYDRLTEVLPAVYSSAAANYTKEENAEQVEYEYSSSNRLSKVTTGSTVYTFTYDGFGNSTEIKAGNNTLANYEYNSNNGKLKKVTYGNGYTEYYYYNDLENLERICYTDNTTTTETTLYSYTYTSSGQVATVTNHQTGKVNAYYYDSSGKLSSIGEYKAETLDKNYEFTEIYVYNDQGRLSYRKDKLPYEVGGESYDCNVYTSYTYNSDGSIASSFTSYTTAAYETGSVNTVYTYDSFKRLSNVSYTYSSSFSRQAAYSFTESGENTSLQISGYTSTVTQGETSTVTGYSYTYDGNGNITKIIYQGQPIIEYVEVPVTDEEEDPWAEDEYPWDEEETEPSYELVPVVVDDGIREIRYEYDNLGQLIREENEQLGKIFVYTYDKAGNITSKTVYIMPEEEGASAELESVVNYGYATGDNAWGDQLTEYNGVEINYDEIGNPKDYYNGAKFTWLGRQLVGAEYDGKTMSFTYNDEGIRTSKTVNRVTTTYYLSGSQIIGEETNGNITVYLYDAAGSVIGMQYHASGSTSTVWDSYWFEKNLQGDIVAIYDNSGTKLITYTYDAWGNTTVAYHNGGESTSAVNNRFTYRGYYYDYDLGLYYLQSRYYDSVTCRFISADEVRFLGANGDLFSYNLYAYCSNDPINRYDPTGHSAIAVALLVGALVGGAIGGIYGGVTATANDQNVFAGALIGFGAGALMGAGAGLASLYLAPIIVGQVVVVGGVIYSAGAALVIGSGIAFGFGFIGGMAADALTQVVNEGNVNDWGSVFASGVQWGIINTASAFLGSLGGPVSTLESTVLSGIFGSVTSALGMAIDILRNQGN